MTDEEKEIELIKIKSDKTGVVKRKEKGKWADGSSGNPNGRPKTYNMDRKALFNQTILPYKLEIMGKALQMALDGDPIILKVFLDRMLPVRPKDDPLSDDVKTEKPFDGALSEQGEKITKLVQNQKITPLEGHDLMELVSQQSQLHVIDDMRKDIKILKDLLSVR